MIIIQAVTAFRDDTVAPRFLYLLPPLCNLNNQHLKITYPLHNSTFLLTGIVSELSFNNSPSRINYNNLGSETQFTLAPTAISLPFCFRSMSCRYPPGNSVESIRDEGWHMQPSLTSIYKDSFILTYAKILPFPHFIRVVHEFELVLCLKFNIPNFFSDIYVNVDRNCYL